MKIYTCSLWATASTKRPNSVGIAISNCHNFDGMARRMGDIIIQIVNLRI
jgi:tRNA (Thr-GGU) A37 N-methylase